jgi:hypothetical protein
MGKKQTAGVWIWKELIKEGKRWDKSRNNGGKARDKGGGQNAVTSSPGLLQRYGTRPGNSDRNVKNAYEPLRVLYRIITCTRATCSFRFNFTSFFYVSMSSPHSEVTSWHSAVSFTKPHSCFILQSFMTPCCLVSIKGLEEHTASIFRVEV